MNRHPAIVVPCGLSTLDGRRALFQARLEDFGFEGLHQGGAEYVQLRDRAPEWCGHVPCCGCVVGPYLVRPALVGCGQVVTVGRINSALRRGERLCRAELVRPWSCGRAVSPIAA